MANKMTQAGLAEFNRVIQQFTEKLVPEELLLLHKKLALEALARVVLKTPVDTGRARGNWQVSVVQIPASEVPWPKAKNLRGKKKRAQLDASQSSGTIQKGTTEIGKLKAFGVVYLVNNVPYIVALEEGHSKQAPAGMLMVTLAELRQMFP